MAASWVSGPANILKDGLLVKYAVLSMHKKIHGCNVCQLVQIFNFRAQVFGYITNPDINTNVFFTFENNLDGTLGIAWVGSVCNSNLSIRASVNEWYNTDALTGMVSLGISIQGEVTFLSVQL